MATDRLDPDALDWSRGNGLLPAVVQDAGTRQVLMLGYMDRAALQASLASGWVTFHSRRRGALWTKGETSGNRLRVVAIAADCDADALLVQATPLGPTCHGGTRSCFTHAPLDALADLDALVARRDAARPASSYTATLLESGVAHVAQKVGEEGVETALAAVTRGDIGLLDEAADLLFHLVVLLRARGLSLADARAVLAQRAG